MSLPRACPDVEHLRQLTLGELPGAEAEAIEAHALHCAECASVLNSLYGKDPRAGDSAGEIAAPEQLEPTLPVADAPVAATLSGMPGSAPAPTAAFPELPGYEILEELGRGGQSVVWKARQRSLDRLVAVKMILAGAAADPEERARFRREAEAVAHLRHPNIVQIYDVGEQAGQPFFALEYVDGGSLAEKLAGTPQPARAAAQLVATLASAMHWAHERGIVHRDLKPGNVLLAADGTPKISDFGLAKRLQRDATLTQTGCIMGTPSYMAPEQAAGKNRDVGPAADVYALGAVLYAMLTGRPPFLGETPLDTLAQVPFQEPVPPRRLQPTVPRDLDTIALKCLQKAPARRYATAAALADDLGRFCRGEPIRARPVGPVERLWRWGGRKPALAGALATLLVVILGSIGGLSVLYVNAEKQRRLAEHEEAGARAITKFFEDNVLAAARPIGWEGGAGPDVTLKETLDHAATKIDDAFAGQPEREAAVRNTIGMTYWYLGRFDAADPHFDKAYRLRGEHLGPEHPDTLTSLHNLAMVRSKRDQFDQAIVHARAALAGRRRVLGTEHPDTLRTQLILGYAYRKNHQTDEAAAVLEPATEACRRTLGPEHPLTLSAQFDLAAVLWNQGKTAQAIALKRTTLEGRRRTLGAEHPDTLRSQGNLGVALMDVGQFAEAEDLCRQTLTVRQHVLGAEHLETLWSQWFLADVLSREGRGADAEKLLRAGLDVCRRKLPPNHADTLAYLALLGDVLCQVRRPAEAEPFLRECLTLREQPLGRGDYWDTAAARSLLGHCLAEQGKLAEAEPLLLAGYDDLIGAQAAPTRQLKRAAERIVALCERWGRKEQAEAWRKKTSEH
jgi:tetratricopeptide (TPR) repeat protein/predicted Ser/Thr protein kinase